jgi:hypothetical protein
LGNYNQNCKTTKKEKIKKKLQLNGLLLLVDQRGTRVSKQLSPSNSRANRGFSCCCLQAISLLVSSIFTCCLWLLLLASAGT